MYAELAFALLATGALCALLSVGGWLSAKVPARAVRRFEGAKKQPARCSGQAATKKSSTP